MVYKSFEFLPSADISSGRERPMNLAASGMVKTCDIVANKFAESDPP